MRVILTRERKSSSIVGFSQIVSSFEKCPNKHKDYSRKINLLDTNNFEKWSTENNIYSI